MSGEPISTLTFIISVVFALLILIGTSIYFNKDAIFGSNDDQLMKLPFFMILGGSSVGKTYLFERLTNEGEHPLLTVTSQETNRGIFRLPSDELIDGKRSLNLGDYELIDFPANPKLKQLYLIPFLKRGNASLKNCKGLIYILDASTFNDKMCNEIARDMIEFLNYTERLPNGIDICVFCNKANLFNSKKSSKIKSMLEEEITRVYNFNLQNLNKVDKQSTISNMDSNGDNEGDENDPYVLSSAFQNKVFKFESLEGNVDFVEGNMFKQKDEKKEDPENKTNLNNLYDWIDERGVN